MNDIFKGIRKLPITALARATYFRLGLFFTTKGEKWSLVLWSRQLFSESLMKVMKEETLKVSTYVVTIFDRHKHIF